MCAYALGGSVDWNSCPALLLLPACCHSPWWECGLKLNIPKYYAKFPDVTPLGGSVDWNFCLMCVFIITHSSLPLVGVWIEIWICCEIDWISAVTPLGGSVDWNNLFLILSPAFLRHSPWWECGLKFLSLPLLKLVTCHSPWWECGLKFCFSLLS